MPPRFTSLPQVGENQSPNARMAPVPQGTFDTRQAQQNLEIVRQEQEKIDFYDAVDRMTQLKKWENESGYQSVLGENARELPKRMRDEYQKRAGELADTIQNPRARLMFQRKADENEISFIGNVEQHSLRQKTVAEAQKVDASVSTWQDAGAKAAGSGDFAGVDNAANQIDQVWRIHGAANGIPAVAVEDSIKKSNSKMYSGAVIDMINSRNDQGAMTYFGQVKDKLTDDDVRRLLPKLTESSTLGNAYRLVDSVFTQAADFREGIRGGVAQYDTLNDVLDAVRAADGSDDPEVRRKAEQIAGERWQAQKLANKDQEDKTYEAVAADLRKTGRLEDIQRSEVWTRLSEKDKEHLEMQARKMLDGKISEERAGKLASFYAKSQDELVRTPKADLERLAPYLSEGEYVAAVKHWNSARNKDENAVFKFNEADESRIFKAMQAAKLGEISGSDTLQKVAKSESKSKAWMEFRQEAMNALEAHFQKDKRNADPKERDQIINDLIVEKAVKKDDSNFLTKYGLYGMGTGIGLVGGASLYGIGKAIDKFRAPSMTDTERERIKTVVMRVKGEEPSEEKILMLKRAELAGASPELLQRLAGE